MRAPRLLAMLAATALVSACSSDYDYDNANTGPGEGDLYEAAPMEGTGRADPRLSDYGTDLSGGTSQEDFDAAVGAKVYFAYDSSSLNSTAKETLQRQAGWLKERESISITVEGHADERGTREYNLALGERRANSVRNYLIGLGVDAGRVEVISYGKEKPAVAGSNPVSWAKNRRGVTVVE